MSLWVHAIGMPAPVGVHLNPNSFFIRISVTRWQDHFQSLAITTMNICRSLIIKIAKVGRKCCQILTNPKNIAKYFLCFAKLAKFRQLWSHWPEFNCVLPQTYLVRLNRSHISYYPKITTLQNRLHQPVNIKWLFSQN